MNKISQYIIGDKALWAIIVVISLMSFLPVYSASSNLQYVIGSGTSFSHLVKHASFIVSGLIFVFLLQKINYKYFGGFAVFLLPVTIVALVATLYQGNTIDGANASRWLKIPGIPFTFQTSSFAALILMVYIARYLTKNLNKKFNFKDSIIPLFFPILIIVGLIFPANGSTAIMIFFFCMLLLFIGNFPLKFLATIGIIGIAAAGLFIFLALQLGDSFKNNRVHTWKSRIEGFVNDTGLETYQVMQAKTAIVTGGVSGVGPGKSAMKQTLPQSSSDFIFAIIVEEYGIMGACFLICIYIFLLYRIIFIATRIHTVFGKLLVLGVGIPIIAQAFINMAVAVNLIPVTGQPLPLISYGGTSMWVTYIALGMILNVSTHMISKEEMELQKNKKRTVIEDIA